MAKKKQFYTIIKLAPNVSAWCDPSNNIYLSKGRRTSQRLKDDCDMKMINKGVKAGLVMLKQCEEEVEVKAKPEVKNAALARARAKKEKEKAETKAEPVVKNEVKVEINVIEEDKKDDDKEE